MSNQYSDNPSGLTKAQLNYRSVLKMKAQNPKKYAAWLAHRNDLRKRRNYANYQLEYYNKTKRENPEKHAAILARRRELMKNKRLRDKGLAEIPLTVLRAVRAPRRDSADYTGNPTPRPIQARVANDGVYLGYLVGMEHPNFKKAA